MKTSIVTIALALLSSAKLYAQPPVSVTDEMREIKKIIALQHAEIQKLKLNSTEIFRGELAKSENINNVAAVTTFAEKENSNPAVFAVVSEGPVKGLKFLKPGKIIGLYVQDVMNTAGSCLIKARINEKDISLSLDSTAPGHWGMITSSFTAQVQKGDVLNFTTNNVSSLDSGLWSVLNVMWQGSLQ